MKRYALILLLLLVTVAQTAPAPRPKPPKPPKEADLVGYEFKWQYGIQTGILRLLPNGYFQETLGSQRWDGQWSYKNGKLWTNETYDGKHFTVFEYQFENPMLFWQKKPMVGKVISAAGFNVEVKLWEPKIYKEDDD